MAGLPEHFLAELDKPIKRNRHTREVRYCPCPSRVQLLGSVSMTIGKCVLCRIEARKLLGAGELLALAASYGERGATLQREGYPTSATAWLYEAGRVKKEAQQRKAAEVTHG